MTKTYKFINFLTIFINLCFLLSLPTLAEGINAENEAHEIPSEKDGNFFTATDFVLKNKKTSLPCDLQTIRIGKHENFTRIVLDFHEVILEQKFTPAVPEPPNLEIKSEKRPNRLIINLHVRRASALNQDIADKTSVSNNKIGKIGEVDEVKAIYKIPTFDDAKFVLAIDLANQIEYEVFALKNPARLVIDLRQNLELPKNTKTYYAVVCPPTDAPENLQDIENYLQEHYKTLRPRWLKAEKNQWLLETMQFENQEEAKKFSQSIKNAGTTWHVEPRTP